MTEPSAARIEEVADYTVPRGRWARPVDSIVLSLGPIVLALLTCGVLLAIIGRDPVAFFRDIVAGRPAQQVRASRTRSRAWRPSCSSVPASSSPSGAVSGTSAATASTCWLSRWWRASHPAILSALPPAIGWVVLCLIAIAVGAVWTLVPSLLKVRYGLNEIVTSLMMTFIGVSLANLLIKGPFRGPTVIPQTLVVDPSLMFMNLPGTRIHIGVVLALVVVIVVHLVLTRSSFGTRLDVLGANPRAALHLGINVPRMIVVTFLISGGLIGLAAAVDMLGIFGYMRADWDPDYALKVVPLVFLARLNVIAVIPLAAFFGVLSIGGDYAARKADVPNVFLLLVVGLILLFMVVTQYLSDKRARGEPLLPTRLRGQRSAPSTHDRCLICSRPPS